MVSSVYIYYPTLAHMGLRCPPPRVHYPPRDISASDPLPSLKGCETCGPCGALIPLLVSGPQLLLLLPLLLLLLPLQERRQGRGPRVQVMPGADAVKFAHKDNYVKAHEAKVKAEEEAAAKVKAEEEAAAKWVPYIYSYNLGLQGSKNEIGCDTMYVCGVIYLSMNYFDVPLAHSKNILFDYLCCLCM
jgi:hypothetical protein